MRADVLFFILSWQKGLTLVFSRPCFGAVSVNTRLNLTGMGNTVRVIEWAVAEIHILDWWFWLNYYKVQSILLTDRLTSKFDFHMADHSRKMCDFRWQKTHYSMSSIWMINVYTLGTVRNSYLVLEIEGNTNWILVNTICSDLSYIKWTRTTAICKPNI